MPLYEFRCTKCSHEFEEITSISDDGSGLQCPKCDEKGAERLISAVRGKVKGKFDRKIDGAL